MAKPTGKMADWVAKKMKDAPAKFDKSNPVMPKEDMKEALLQIEMTKLSNAELKELAEKAKYRYSGKSRYTRSDMAMDELDRRGLKKFMKQQKIKYDDDSHNPVYNDTTNKRLSDAYSASDLRKEIDRFKKGAKDKKGAGFQVGGMPAKKPVARKPVAAKAKAPAKKPVARKPTVRK